MRMQVKAEDSARLAALKKEVTGAEAELAKLEKSAAGLVEQTEELQGQIDNAGGAKMKKQKQNVSDLQQVICAQLQVTAVFDLLVYACCNARLTSNTCCTGNLRRRWRDHKEEGSDHSCRQAG